ncbi:DNA helicase IV [Vibrio sp. WJH972]
MQLQANQTAKYFINDEYCQVELDNDTVIVSSALIEEQIPFSVWDGSIHIQRGIFWGQLVFYSQPKDGSRYAWVVQGLPWSKCREFAKNAITSYEQWHEDQCQKLREFYPRWRKQLHQLEFNSGFLRHSMLMEWCVSVAKDLESLEMSMEEIQQRIPDLMGNISEWFDHSASKLDVRNQDWLVQESPKWSTLFSEFESSPLNTSQQKAILMNDDHNLILAGAGSGKTSVLTARVAYLLESDLATGDDILLLAFGRDAAKEMETRIRGKVGPAANHVQINTFHQLGLAIINQVEEQRVQISSIATDAKKKTKWCAEWLKKHWMTPTNFKRWQKHLGQWPIAYIKGDEELGSHVEDPKLIQWLLRQLEQLAMLGKGKKALQEQIIDHADYTRLNSELALCWPCYKAWKEMLEESGELDFDSMISKATRYIKKGKFKSPWRFIMVDEYQDISPARLELIDALCRQDKGKATLFAVGDDWQSIYQFAGSNVSLTTEFKERFANSTISELDTTYRFNNKIGEVANQFVQRNPNQLIKTLNSVVERKRNSVFVAPQTSIEKILDQINRGADVRKSVLFLARTNSQRPELLSDWEETYRQLNLSFMTCHGSKGAEADYVIVVNVDEGQFPLRNKTQSLDAVLVDNGDDYPDSEERRLFYVALTRAREKVWVTHTTGGSSFVKELLSGDYDVSKSK